MVKPFEVKLMGYLKKNITPLLTHWSYVFLAPTHWNMLAPYSDHQISPQSKYINPIVQEYGISTAKPLV